MIERFYLTIAIMTGIALAGAALGLMLSGRVNALYKPSFFYFILLVMTYEISTLIAFYLHDAATFRTAVLIKSFAGVLMKSAFLILMGLYIGKKWAQWLFVGVHLLSFPFILAHFVIPGFMDVMVVFGPGARAFYGSGCLWYALVSNLFYLIAALLLYRKWKAQKVKGALILIVLIILNIVMMTYFMASGADLLREKMHLMVLLGMLFFVSRKTPFLVGKNQFLLHAEMMEALSDEVLIYNQKGRLVYVHAGLDQLTPAMSLTEMLSQLARDPQAVPLEGEFSKDGDKPLFLYYKILPVQNDEKDYGTIIVIRDITPIVLLRRELEERNKQQIEAYSRQKDYVKLSKKLIAEEERAKILERVNEIADAYITGVREEILKLQEAISKKQENIGLLVCEKNEYMLGLTRKALEEIRSTVRKLNMQQSGRA